MMDLSSFDRAVHDITGKLRSAKGPCRIIIQKDADGITSACLMGVLLNHLQIPHELTILPHVDEELLAAQKGLAEPTLIFCDVGSSYLDMLESALEEKEVFIFDHHHLRGRHKHCKHLSIREHGADTDFFGCTATTVYACLRTLGDFRRHARTAILGAIGDYQLKDHCEGINKIAVDDALAFGSITFMRDLNIFGRDTRPLHKALGRCDFSLPGVHGERDAKGFLYALGIYKGPPRTYTQLSSEEQQRLIQEIIRRKKDEQDLYCNAIMFTDVQLPLRDAFEYASLLTSQVRMGNVDLALGLCMFDTVAIEKSREMRKQYQYRLKKTLGGIDDQILCRDDRKCVIDLGSSTPPDMIATVASVLAKSRRFLDGTLIYVLGDLDEVLTKISSRVSGLSKQHTINAKDILEHALEKITTNVGGHSEAAGAVIRTVQKDETIEALKRI